MSAKPVVLHVIPNLHFGGAALGAIELVRELSRRGNYELRLCVIGSSDGAMPSDLVSNTIFLGVADPTGSVYTFVKSVLKLRKTMRESSARIAHSHLLPADLLAAWATALNGGIRHIAHIRDTRPWITSRKARDRVRVWLHRMAYALSGTRFIAVSTSSARHARDGFRMDQTKMSVVLNGIDLNRLNGESAWSADAGVFHIGCAGRLVAEKGFRHVVQAVSLLANTGHDVAMTIAGSGSLEGALRDEAARLGVSARLRIVHNVDDMGAFLGSLDAVVVPSLATEGLPRVAMEGMAMGKAVVATETAGVEDLITHGIDGLLVPPADPKALADCLLSLKARPSLRQKLADNGRKRVLQNFTVQRVAQDVERLYRDLTLGTPESAETSPANAGA